MRLLLLCWLMSSVSALFFPTSGGGGGCCCGCGTPQPASCGCGPVCPPPQPCPSCPPPPTAICPQVQPIYIPACSGSSCGGGYSSGCSGGSCGGGGYAASSCSGGSCGGGYATSGGGGYATSGGGGGYVSNVAPASGYASSGGGGGGGYSAPIAVPAAANEAGYSAGGGGGYQQHVAAADDPKGTQEGVEHGPIPPPATLPPLNQAFRAPQICEPQKIKYIVLRAKKLPGRSGEGDLEEEVEEVGRPTPLEATAAPLDPKEIGEELLHGEEELGDTDGGIQARGAPTLTDAKCNSKALRDLIMENIVRDDALASKRQIHETSIKRFPEHTVDVICSTTGFTYLVSTTEHCEAQRDNVICFVYKRPI